MCIEKKEIKKEEIGQDKKYGKRKEKKKKKKKKEKRGKKREEKKGKGECSLMVERSFVARVV